MQFVRMETSHGRCCMTAEMCAFAEYGDVKKDRIYSHLGTHVNTAVNHGHSGTRVSDYFYGWGETTEQAWKNALAEIQKSMEQYSYNGYQVRYFWFVKYDGDTEYVADSLRTIISTTPGVVKLGEMRNANTYNTLDGYMLSFEQTNGSDGEIDDDDY